MGILSTSRTLLGTWAQTKKRQLQNRGTPDTRVDSGGNRNSYSFDGQELSRDELREIKEIRESGGFVSQLVHGKSIMQFGMGATFEAENDDASEWLEDQFGDLDNLLIDIGEDATWFPYALGEIVETQGGDFSHLELIEPWTMLPVENEHGEIIAWEQEIQGDFGAVSETFEPDEIATVILNKAYGRDKTGLSEVKRAEDEITNYKENQQTINEALEYLIPHNHWKVGKEGGAVIDDNELRRVRNKINDMGGDTQIITGHDVDQEAIELPSFDVQQITDNDVRQLCVALGVPIELASVISEGLGSGEQSGMRGRFFQLERRAKQRALGGQFVEQVARILLRDYSPYDPEQQLDLVFDETQEISERKSIIDAVGDDMTVNERREIFDMAPLDDESVGEDFERPAKSESDEPMGGLFQDSVESALDSRDLEDDKGNENWGDVPEWDSYFLDLHNRIWTADDTRNLLQFGSSQVPEFVKERLKTTLREESVLFEQIDAISSSDRMQLQEYLVESLSEDRWSIDGISDQIEQLGVSSDRADTIARTEVASAVNTARSEGYQERGDEDGELFYWTGATKAEQPERTTDACDWLIRKTNPNHGGTPVSMDRLKELIEEAPEHDDDMQDDLARPDNFIVHPQERKTFVRYVEG
jgi:hypothetical protein